jgi:hypothetical protein
MLDNGGYVDYGEKEGDQVVMPVGGAGGCPTLVGGGIGRAPTGISPASRNRHSTRCAGRAALGATRPDQLSAASVSPTCWYGGQLRLPGRGGVRLRRA